MTASNTFVGLLRHEFRLTLRTWFARKADGKLRGLPQMIITAIALLLIFGLGGIPAGLALRGFRVTITPLLEVIGAASACALFSLMLSQTLAAAVALLYDRGDLDLLLSSPTSPTRILAARAVSMAMSVTLLFALILAPILLPIAALGHPSWLAAFLVLFAIAFAATGAGLLLAVLLMSTIGPRRTKATASVLAALVGASLFIMSQLSNIVGHEQAGSFWTRLALKAQAGEVVLPVFATWPAQAAVGEPAPLAIMVLLAVTVFTASVLLLGRRFAENAAVAKGADSPARSSARVRAARFGRGPFRALLQKELRLLRRDAALLSQVLLRVLYIFPLVFVIVRNAGSVRHVGLAGAAAALTFMAGQVTGSLSWITISAEEAPDLLAMSPTRTALAWRAKLAASVLPVAAILGLPLLVVIAIAPLQGLWAVLGCGAASLSSGLVNIWMQKPSKRRDFRGRRDASLGATFAELSFCALWAGAAGLAVSDHLLFAAAPAAIAVLALLLLNQREETILARLADAAS